MRLPSLTLLAAALIGASTVPAQTISPAAQSKIDARLRELAAWAAAPEVVAAVRAHNTALAPEHASLTQEKWRTLTVLDPLVRGFSKNAAAAVLKARKDEVVTEAFLSGATGMKVAFLTKPSNWSHRGKDKHDVPMSGKSWQGPIEVDESSGQQQLQIAVPVLDGGKAIGSLVVGLSLTRLSQ